MEHLRAILYRDYAGATYVFVCYNMSIFLRFLLIPYKAKCLRENCLSICLYLTFCVYISQNAYSWGVARNNWWLKFLWICLRHKNHKIPSLKYYLTCHLHIELVVEVLVHQLPWLLSSPYTLCQQHGQMAEACQASSACVYVCIRVLHVCVLCVLCQTCNKNTPVSFSKQVQLLRMKYNKLD